MATQSLKSDRARRALAAAAVVCLGLAGAGCSSKPDMAKLLNPDPPEKMYEKADGFLSRGRFEDAAKVFEEVDRDHPYAPQARRAIVMSSYAYYKAGKYPEAIAAARRYTTLHPGTKEAALAHHIIASSYFDEIKDPARDQSNTRKALSELKIVQARFPDSPYAKQAENRIRLAEDTLAAAEMSVGRYYLTRNQHLAAINRFKTVVAEYQTTAHVEEALMRLTEGYMALGIKAEAQAAAAVLGHNFPNSKWYKDAHALLKSDGLAPRADTGSWISRTLRNFVPSQQPRPVAKPETITLPPSETKPPAAQEPANPPPVEEPSSVPTARRTSPGRMGLTTSRE